VIFLEKLIQTGEIRLTFRFDTPIKRGKHSRAFTFRNNKPGAYAAVFYFSGNNKIRKRKIGGDKNRRIGLGLAHGIQLWFHLDGFLRIGIISFYILLNNRIYFMKIIDLSYNINPAISVYPGTEPPSFIKANTIERDGFAEMKMSMYTHTATHMDAPSHVLPHGKSLDKFDASHFVGRAVIVDAPQSSGKEITVELLKPYLEQLQNADFVLIKTGWSKYWGKDNYFKEFPSLSVDAAKWLAELPLKGIGIDAISIDSVDNVALPAHHILLEKDIIIIENLTNLDVIKTKKIYFICLPLKISDADGSPVRAIAIENFVA
jgi:arylformamidase